MRERLSGGRSGQIFFSTRGELEVIILLDRTEGYEDDINGDTLHLKSLLDGELFKLNSRSRFAEFYYKLNDEDQEDILKKIFEDKDLWR